MQTNSLDSIAELMPGITTATHASAIFVSLFAAGNITGFSNEAKYAGGSTQHELNTLGSSARDASFPCLLRLPDLRFGTGVVGVMAFRSVSEAIELANATPYGLAAYLYTNDLHEMEKISKALQAGSVAVSNVDAGIMNVAYGRWKQSGVGYEHGHEGLEEYLQLKHVRVRFREPA